MKYFLALAISGSFSKDLKCHLMVSASAFPSQSRKHASKVRLYYMLHPRDGGCPAKRLRSENVSIWHMWYSWPICSVCWELRGPWNCHHVELSGEAEQKEFSFNIVENITYKPVFFLLPAKTCQCGLEGHSGDTELGPHREKMHKEAGTESGWLRGQSHWKTKSRKTQPKW